MATAQVENVNHLIEVRSIGKDYRSGETTVQAIKGMDFFIDDGEFVSIMGQSGSGKSTLLSIMGGLNHPSRGQLVIDALNLYRLSSEQRADFRSEYIGIIFQSFQLSGICRFKRSFRNFISALNFLIREERFFIFRLFKVKLRKFALLFQNSIHP